MPPCSSNAEIIAHISKKEWLSPEHCFADIICQGETWPHSAMVWALIFDGVFAILFAFVDNKEFAMKKK